MYTLGFGLGNFTGFDLLIVFLVVLLLFGGKRLPELARGLGSALNEFNKAKDDLHRQITQPPADPAAPAAEEKTAEQSPAAPGEPDKKA